MENVISEGTSNRETELRKRCLNEDLIEPRIRTISEKNFIDETKPVTTNATTTISENERKKITKATESTEMKSSMIVKRSLSESSAEEYNRSSESASGSGSNQRKMWHNEFIINPESKERQPNRRQRPNNDVGDCTNKRNRNHYMSDMIDVGIRMAIVIIFIKLETTKAFQRNIHVQELWLYKNPRTDDIVTPAELILSVIIAPFVVTLLHLYLTGDRRDFRAANWVWTLSLCLNGLTTSTLKLSIGRPRPDFFYRCFPDGIMVANVTPTAVNFNCTGNSRVINEGFKSFPSGHASFAFASFGFIAIYWAGKLHAFNTNGRGESWRLFASIWPLFIAALIAISRTCDYHHHWQDVLAGSFIGLCVAYLTYRQYYPSIFSLHSHRPLPRDGRHISTHEYRYGSRQSKRNYIDNLYPAGLGTKKHSKSESKDDRLVSEDQMPLICGEDDVEQLNSD